MTRLLPAIRPFMRLGLALALSTSMAHAVAQTAASAPASATPAAEDARASHATGDAWLDARLADIDVYAARYPDAFAAELERYAGVPRAYVIGLLAQPGWGGGDAWFACFLAHATQSTCRSVVRGRSNPGAGVDWEQVAADFGARPGSDAYVTVRLALADSYRRWARPLQPDAALSRALRKRAQAEAEEKP